MLGAPLEKKNPVGTPVYADGIHKLVDTADPSPLIRNAFTSQVDDNCIVVLAGPATNLVNMLDLPGAKDWITRKVRFLAVACGRFADGAPDERIKADVKSAKRLFAEWPTPIIAAGTELGEALP